MKRPRFGGVIVDARDKLGPAAIRCVCGTMLHLNRARVVYRCGCGRAFRRSIEQIIECDQSGWVDRENQRQGSVGEGTQDAT